MISSGAMLTAGTPRLLPITSAISESNAFVADGMKSRARGVHWQQEQLDTTVNYISEQAGERWEQMELNVLVQAVVVTDNKRKAVENFASRVSGLSIDDALTAPFLAIGTHNEIADYLEACRNRWGISYFSVRDLEGFAPVIHRLRGN